MAVVSDPYGIDIALDGNGDVVVWPNGAMGTIDGPPNCVQALQARMLTRPGELTLNPTYGSTFQAIVGRKYALPIVTGAAANEVKQIIGQDSRFLAGQDVKADYVDGNPEAVRVGVQLILSAGDRIVTADLTSPTVSEAISPADTDLADLSAVTAFEDYDFLAQDAAELSALNDAAALAAITQPDPEVF